MGGGKGGASSPDYSAVAQADTIAAQNQYALGQQQLQWGKDQFNTIWPEAQKYMDQQTASSAAETKNAQDAQDMYNSTYKPVEQKFADQAAGYDTKARADANAGGAMGDVASSFDANRAASLSNLESFGIDPSQTRFGALDLGTRISQAAATAAAGTQSRLNTEATGLALEGEAVNTGRGYSSNVANAYSTATGAGAAGINAANQTAQTGGQLMGTAPQYYGLGNQSMSNVGQMTQAQGNFALGNAQLQQQAGSSMMSGIGSLVGGAIGVAGIAI